MDTTYLLAPVFFAIAFIEAIPLGMLLNLVNSSSATVTYGSKRLVAWRVALPFAVTMMVFAPIGAWLNVKTPVKPLLTFFALFTASAAILMLSGWKPKRGEMSPRGRVALGLAAGSGLGLIAGLIGRGGGSFIVPLLYIAGLEARVAAATSAPIVTCSGLSSFISHLATAAQPQWHIWIACVVAVLAGSQLGSRVMAGRIKSRVVKKVFGYVLLGISALILIKDVIWG